MTSADHVESNALALTPWGASTLDALQSSSEADREAVARRACEDAVADARSMVSLQGSLFEKLLVIERFGLYRALGHASIQEFIDREVAPLVQLHRKTLYKLREAVGEAARLIGRYGTLKADWSNVYLLAAETRRQGVGDAVLDPEAYERLSRQVAEGQVSQRELAATLQRRAVQAHRPKPRCIDAPRKERPSSPFDELARITADVRRPVQRPVEDLAPVMVMARQLVQRLDSIVIQPIDGMTVGGADLPAFRQLMAELAETAAAASRIGRREEAA